MEKEYIYIGAIMITIMTVAMFFMLFYIYNKKRERQEAQLNRAELSYMREYFEKRLYELNSKLSEDKDRWKDINHLLLSYKPNVNEDYFKTKSTFNSSFFTNFGIIPENKKVLKNQVFVLTPFYSKELDTFNAIKLACNEIGLQCTRGDEEFIKGDIFSFILDKMLESRIVIANINGRNPNVFYELGIAQAIGKPTIVISQNLEDIPFDIKSQNILIYKDLTDLNYKLNNMFSRILIDEN